MRSNILFLMALLGTTVGWTGCSGSHVPPAKADNETAVEMLKLTLDYWKSGETASSLRSQSPGVHAADDDWQAGHQLLAYHLLDTQPVIGGVSARIPAILEILGPAGSNRKVVHYLVSTNPSCSVVRQDDEPE